MKDGGSQFLGWVKEQEPGRLGVSSEKGRSRGRTLGAARIDAQRCQLYLPCAFLGEPGHGHRRCCRPAWLRPGGGLMHAWVSAVVVALSSVPHVTSAKTNKEKVSFLP